MESLICVTWVNAKRATPVGCGEIGSLRITLSSVYLSDREFGDAKGRLVSGSVLRMVWVS